MGWILLNILLFVQSLTPLCEDDNQAQEIIKKLEKSITFLSQCTARVASRAEMLGAINQVIFLHFSSYNEITKKIIFLEIMDYIFRKNFLKILLYCTRHVCLIKKNGKYANNVKISLIALASDYYKNFVIYSSTHSLYTIIICFFIQHIA